MTTAAASAALKLRRSKSLSAYGSFCLKRADDPLSSCQIPDEKYWDGNAEVEMLMVDG